MRVCAITNLMESLLQRSWLPSRSALITERDHPLGVTISIRCLRCRCHGPWSFGRASLSALFTGRNDSLGVTIFGTASLPVRLYLQALHDISVEDCLPWLDPGIYSLYFVLVMEESCEA